MQVFFQYVLVHLVRQIYIHIRRSDHSILLPSRLPGRLRGNPIITSDFSGHRYVLVSGSLGTSEQRSEHAMADQKRTPENLGGYPDAPRLVFDRRV
jgi:hypothetical protein